MLNEFLLRSALAGVGVALAAGPLGCVVVWRRMAYFGDAVAHGAILGVALSLATHTPIFAGVLLAALAMAAFVSTLSGRSYAADTLLGVASHSAVAFGMIALALTPGARSNLEAYLFGDILAVGWRDLALIWAAAAVCLGLLIWRWDRLLSATISPDIAAAEGGDPARERLIATLALALLVAAAAQVVGALLITAMLIIPAAAARAATRSPETMAVAAALIGAAAALLGLGASWEWDTPAGPSMVAAAAGMFAALAVRPRA